MHTDRAVGGFDLCHEQGDGNALVLRDERDAFIRARRDLLHQKLPLVAETVGKRAFFA